MFLKKQHDQRTDEMMEMLQAILPPQATLLSFDYNAECFGNIIAEIELTGTKHIFITDRGEIYHNGIMLCDSSYRGLEKEDTFTKLLQMIQKELSLRNP